MSATAHQRTLVPVRPAEPLAGAPDRSPIPLADNVQAAGRRGQRPRPATPRRRGRWRVRAGRRPGPGPPAQPTAGIPAGHAARIAARDAAPRSLALLALLVVFGGLGTGRVGVRPGGTGTQAISSVDAGQEALEMIRANLDKVTGPGIDLVDGRTRAGQRAADRGLPAARRVASQDGIQAATIEPLREQTIDGLDRLYGVVPGELARRSSRSSRRRASRRST